MIPIFFTHFFKSRSFSSSRSRLENPDPFGDGPTLALGVGPQISYHSSFGAGARLGPGARVGPGVGDNTFPEGAKDKATSRSSTLLNELTISCINSTASAVPEEEEPV